MATHSSYFFFSVFKKSTHIHQTKDPCDKGNKNIHFEDSTVTNKCLIQTFELYLQNTHKNDTNCKNNIIIQIFYWDKDQS